jgi:hypothetical protein
MSAVVRNSHISVSNPDYLSGLHEDAEHDG